MRSAMPGTRKRAGHRADALRGDEHRRERAPAVVADAGHRREQRDERRRGERDDRDQEDGGAHTGVLSRCSRAFADARPDRAAVRRVRHVDEAQRREGDEHRPERDRVDHISASRCRSPEAPCAMPASAGPMTRPRLNCALAEVTPTPSRSSRGTRSGIIAVIADGEADAGDCTRRAGHGRPPLAPGDALPVAEQQRWRAAMHTVCSSVGDDHEPLAGRRGRRCAPPIGPSRPIGKKQPRPQ